MTKKKKAPKLKKPKQEIPEDLKNLVVFRLNLYSDKAFSIGSEKREFTKKELIEHVKKEDEIGQKVAEIEITFLKALKDGALLEEILTSDSG